MKYPALLLTALALMAIPSAAAPLTRADITSIPAGPVAFKNTPLTEVLMAAKNIAATRQIHLRADPQVIELGRKQAVTLHAEGLTLDALLEYASRSGGTDWKFADGGILVFSTAALRSAHQSRLQSDTRQKLAKIVIPEISFDNIEIAAAIRMVRENAVRLAGIGAVPKFDLPANLSSKQTVSLKLRHASVLSLLDLLAAASVSSIDWKIEGSLIVVFDEAERRRDQLRRSVARRKQADSSVDPFSAPSAARPATAPAPAQPRPEGNIIRQFNTESYDHFGDNPFFSPVDEPLSTFSADVDTASYSNIRRMIKNDIRIPLDAARIEELVNYFPYDYDPPARGKAGEAVQGPPFATHIETAPAPWALEHRLVRIGIKGYEIDWDSRPPSNLVFLLDVSGSMNSPLKLALVKDSLTLLVRRLGDNDRVAVVVYAGASGLVLPPTPANRTKKILQAIENLNAGGSTNGGEGIELAYKTAREHFIDNGNNRVILCTDGDFNVGTTDRGSLVGLVEREARSGVFLTALGFGMGNYKDGMLETLSNKGNGNYGYVDSKREARKLFVHGLSGTLVTIAKDVKLQVEFNPAKVGAYRLLGYENRILDARDFDDDSKDAGDIGSGHTVTAFYEIVPPGRERELLRSVAPLKYQATGRKPAAPGLSDELLTLKLRYKEPDGATSKLITIPLKDDAGTLAETSTDFRFAASVASFGMILRDSDYRGQSTLPQVIEIARGSLGDDPHGYRKEFLKLVEKHSRQTGNRRR